MTNQIRGMTSEIRDEADIDTFVQRFKEPEHAGDVPNLLSYLYNYHGNAERLIALYGEDLKYCHAFKKWLVWDGMRWAVGCDMLVLLYDRHFATK
jgi:hypothetical protein